MEIKKRIDFLTKENKRYGYITIIILSGMTAGIIHVFTKDYISLSIFFFSFSFSMPFAIKAIAREVEQNNMKITILNRELQIYKKWN